MSKHTPEPWTVEEGVLVYGPDGMIAEFGFGMRDDPETRANAILATAAPAMFAAMRAIQPFIMPTYQGDPEEFQKANRMFLAALAKADPSP